VPDPMDESFTHQNPIVAAATQMRARRDMAAAVGDDVSAARGEDAEAALRAFFEGLQLAVKRLNAILGKDGVKLVRVEKPLRLRVRFRKKRVALDLNETQQLVRISGDGLEGDYQFSPEAAVPSLINISKLSTEPGYGEKLTPNALIKHVARDAELAPPPHLSGPGPLQF
jgi:hypothetical protein